MIKPWLFEFFHSEHDLARRENPAAMQQRFQDYIDLWTLDDELGWEGIFFSEHHFGPGYSPSPNLVIANVAARTKNIRLGSLGSVTSYATPWRIVEEFAMLDHFTQGRLEMGVIKGIPPELGVVGLRPPLTAELHEEVIGVLMSAIGKPVISHEGKHYAFENIRVSPGFFQASPSVWTASTNPATARRAGELGLKMCTSFGPTEALAKVVEAYHEGAKSIGKTTGPDDVGLRRSVFLVADESEVDEAGAAVQEGSRELFRFVAEALKIPDAAPEQVSPDEAIYGTPDQVADEIIRQCRIARVGHFLAVFNIFDTAVLRRNHELFGREVIPRLRAAGIE